MYFSFYCIIIIIISGILLFKSTRIFIKINNPASIQQFICSVIYQEVNDNVFGNKNAKEVFSFNLIILNNIKKLFSYILDQITFDWFFLYNIFQVINFNLKNKNVI